MRSRLPLFLIALTILFALVAAGCGDDKSGSGDAEPVPALEPTDTGSTGSSGSASASAEKTYNSCVKAADALPDSGKAADAKQRCQDAYENIKDSSAKIDQATSDARAKCEEAANKIPNEEAKSSALAACARFK